MELDGVSDADVMGTPHLIFFLSKLQADYLDALNVYNSVGKV